MRKVAVTTTDGKTVNQHFGKASSFSIYIIDGNNITFIEKRFVEPYCISKGQPIDPDHKLNKDKLSAIYKILYDCDILYTMQIGEKPQSELMNQGLYVQPCSCKIQSLAECKRDCDH